MKKLFIIAIALISYQFGISQLSVGPKAGLGMNWTDLDGTTSDIKSGDAQYGLNIGAFVKIEAAKFYVQPEVIYASTKSDIRIGNGGGFTQQVIDTKLDKFDIPVMLGAKILGPLSLQVGPVASIVVSESDGLGDNINNAIQDYENFNLGFQTGAALDLGSLMIDLRYEGNLKDLGRTEIGGINLDERQPALKASIGFNVF